MTTLARIRQIVRNVTGRQSIDQLSDAQLDNYIDDFYLYDLPEQLKTMQLEEYYTFNTQPNVAIYNLPENYYWVKPAAYMSGYELSWQQDPTTFFRIWPQNKFLETGATGNGGVAYAFTLTNTPILRGSLIIADDTESFTDNSAGILTGSAGGAGTINYITGAVTVNFAVGTAVGVDINAQYYPYVASRPKSVLFYNNTFEFRPIPDQSYEFKCQCLIRPTAMAAVTSSPEIIEWYQMIAYGACLKIFVESGDWDEHAKMYAVFDRQKNLAQRRALKKLATQRVKTEYSGDWDINPGWPLYPY